MDIERIEKIDSDTFLSDFVVKGVPVIIGDGLRDSDLASFRPEALCQHFGDEFAQVYDDLFSLENVQSLSDYVEANFDKPQSADRSRQYIRWYSKLKNVDFLWADHIFDVLKDSWKLPYFVPTTSMVIPYCPAPSRISAVTDRFPYRGLFVSGRGARTRLHRDPWNSNAFLCQFFGEKRIRFFSKDQARDVMNGEEFIDLENPDLSKFPNYETLKSTLEFTLNAGEVVFFPGGTFHDVTSTTDSVSITWNFVHQSGLEGFLEHIENHPNDKELDTVRFFLESRVPVNASAEELKRFFVDENLPGAKREFNRAGRQRQIA